VGFVGLRYRAELRARWLVSLGLAVLIGVGGGVALAAFAGARRTDAAVPSFLAFDQPDDGGFLYGSLESPPVAAGAAAHSLALPPAEQRVVELPEVVAHFRAPYLFLAADPTGTENNVGALNPIGAADPDLFRRADRPMILAGRLPDPSAPFDVAINELAARKRHLHVGSRVHLYAYSADQFAGGGLTQSVSTGPRAPAGPAFTVRVAAIVRFPQDVSAIVPLAAQQNVSYEGQQNMYLTPAFLLRLAAGLGIPVQAIPDLNLTSVRLRHGLADYQAFTADARRVSHGEITVGDAGNTSGAVTAAQSAQRGIHIEVVALIIFGCLAALVTLLVVAQAIGRQSELERDERAALRSLGATSRQLAGVLLLRTAVIAIIGAVLAVGVAVAASPLMPLGLARQAELHPGVSIDATVLGLGAAAIVLLVLASAALPALRIRRRTTTDGDPAEVHASSHRVANTLARWSAPPSVAIGVRNALERGRGRNAVPVATALTSAVLGVAMLTGALTFGASLNHLVDTPRQQGWNWDVLVGNPNDLSDHEAQAAALLAHNHRVGSYSAIAILAGAGQGNMSIDGVALGTFLAIDPLKGSVHPPLLQGRPPRGLHEIVLGDHTLQKLHLTVGDTLRTKTTAGPVALHVVGRMIAPSVGDLFTNSLGDGGWISGALARQVAAAQPQTDNGLPPTTFSLFAVRYAPGVSRDAAFASLERDFGATVLRPLPAEDVVNLHSVDRLPYLLAALIALLATATLANTLISAVRRRRRDLAILKTVGFVRRQVAAVVIWQATTFALVALVIGIPLGVAGGRLAWHLVSSGIGAVSPPMMPAGLIGAVAAATLALANLTAVVPGWAAARVAPAVVIRNE
jgi:ABC-type lipoprotein release transport system permease subunit